MKKVIDAGALRSTELDNFLSASSKNVAVITEYAQMESLKGCGAVNIRNSLQILSKYVKQVIILKSTDDIASLRPRQTGLQSRFIDYKQTAHFSKFCSAIYDTTSNYDGQISDKELRANANFSMLTKNTDSIRKGLNTLLKSYPTDDLKCLRSRKPISKRFAQRVMNDILRVTARLFSLRNEKLPAVRDALYSFQFRHALCSYVLAVKWIADCGHENVPADKLRNDFVDATYAAYATFYDGLITRDNKLLEIYSFSSWLLRNEFLGN